MLLALFAFGMGMVLARGGNANVALESQLPALRAAADRPGAALQDWVRYAQALEGLRRYPDAVIAYQQALKMNAYDRDARLGCVECIARLGNKDDLARFIDDTVRAAPKTAKEFFDKPDVAIFLADARFQELKLAAEAGAQD
jgi:hypothetical protein